MYYLILTFALAFPICPTIKTNINPSDKDDRIAMQEFKDKCKATKAFPCLYTFEKHGKNWYTGECGPFLDDNK